MYKMSVTFQIPNIGYTKTITLLTTADVLNIVDFTSETETTRKSRARGRNSELKAKVKHRAFTSDLWAHTPFGTYVILIYANNLLFLSRTC